MARKKNSLAAARPHAGRRRPSAMIIDCRRPSAMIIDWQIAMIIDRQIDWQINDD